MIKEIIISEPWDFQSSDGENILRVDIVEKTQTCMVATVLSKYEGMTEKILIENRDLYGYINIYHITDVNTGQKRFAMIGKIK